MNQKNQNRGYRGQISPQVMEVVRQEYLAGGTLRELAQKHGISQRALCNYSKRGEWQKQRAMQQSAATVPALVQASDARAVKVAQDWRNDMGELITVMLTIARRASAVLAMENFDNLDIKEIAVLIKLLIDGADKLQGRLLEMDERAGQQGMQRLSDEDASRILRTLSQASGAPPGMIDIEFLQRSAEEEVVIAQKARKAKLRELARID